MIRENCLFTGQNKECPILNKVLHHNVPQTTLYKHFSNNKQSGMSKQQQQQQQQVHPNDWSAVLMSVFQLSSAPLWLN